jgi:hypothetical protein
MFDPTSFFIVVQCLADDAETTFHDHLYFRQSTGSVSNGDHDVTVEVTRITVLPDAVIILHMKMKIITLPKDTNHIDVR